MPDGRPILSGLGLYPEMGADFVPLIYTRYHGRLLGMSLHEEKLIKGGAVLKGFSADPDKVLGEFRGYYAVERDICGKSISGLDEKESQLRV